MNDILLLKVKQKLAFIISIPLVWLYLEAARSKFKLNHQMLNSEWSTLHECILQKRRNEWRNAKKDAGNVPIVAAPQVQELDDFNE